MDSAFFPPTENPNRNHKQFFFISNRIHNNPSLSPPRVLVVEVACDPKVMSVSSNPFLVSTTLPNHHDPMNNNKTMPCLIGIRMNNIKTRRCLISASKSSLALEQLKTSTIDRYTKERSSIVVIGLNIHTAPVEMREKLDVPEGEWSQAIAELRGLNHIEQAAVLSTCNRIEIYVLALSRRRGVKEVTEWMSKRSGIPVSEICQHRFLLYNEDATQHLFQVSAGLDSLVLGEGQILAQVRQVVKTVGHGMIIKDLFEHAIKAGGRVRDETDIAVGAVSVSSAAVELALANLPESVLSARMLVIGAGKMGKLVIKHLVAKGYTEVVVVNRSQEKVAAIREEMSRGVEIIYKPLDEMLACAGEANVIFTSTASETPLFFKEHVKILSPAAKANVRLFVDISVPRNVGSCVGEIDGARVYNVDDLKDVVAANKEERARKAMAAQPIISEETKKFAEWMDSLEAVPTIKKLRAKTERIIVTEVEKFALKLDIDINEETRKAIDNVSHSIMNKVLHGPMKHLRCDEIAGRTLSETLENMEALNRMFELHAELLEEKKIRAKGKQK